jgi:hypothetical protein
VLGLCFTGASAQAQSMQGSLDINGFVAVRCSAAAGGAATLELGELTGSEGRVKAALGDSGELVRRFTVACTSLNPQISLEATPLTTSGADANGYTGTVHYTATLLAAEAAGGSSELSHTTNGQAPSPQSLGGRLSNSENNVSVAIANGFTATDDRLLAGAYSGSVTFVISASN